MKTKMVKVVLAEVDDGPNPEQAKIYFDELRENFDNAMVALKEHGRTNPKTLAVIRNNV